MKRKALIVPIILTILIFTVLFTACGREQSDDGISIVCTVFPQYDITRNITAGTDVNVKMLLPAGSEAHSYEPSPADIKAINDCELFILVGGESEEWAKKMLASSELNVEKSLSLMDITGTLCEEESLSDHLHDHEHDGVEEYDEHVWTSPWNAIKIAEAICERLSYISPENAETYRKNADDYILKLSELDEAFSSLAERANGKKLIFGDRFPFLYLAHEYGFEYVSAFSGCAEQTEASLAVISELIEIVKKDDIPFVFAVDYSNGSLAKTIAAESGAEVLRLYSCHTITQSEIKAGEDYISLMRKNLSNIEKAVLD